MHGWMGMGIEDGGSRREKLWLAGYAIGFGLLFVQALATLVNQISPPLPEYDSTTYISPTNAAQCKEEGGNWISNTPTDSGPTYGSCFLSSPALGSTPQTQALCERVGGIWEEPQAIGAPTPDPANDTNGYCQGPLDREIERDKIQNHHADIEDIVYIIGGAAVVILALLLWNVRGLAAGLLLGGIFALWAVSGNPNGSFFPTIMGSGVTGRAEAAVVAVALLLAAYVGWRVFDSRKTD